MHVHGSPCRDTQNRLLWIGNTCPAHHELESIAICTQHEYHQYYVIIVGKASPTYSLAHRLRTSLHPCHKPSPAACAKPLASSQKTTTGCCQQRLSSVHMQALQRASCWLTPPQRCSRQVHPSRPDRPAQKLSLTVGLGDQVAGHGAHAASPAQRSCTRHAPCFGCALVCSDIGLHL